MSITETFNRLYYHTSKVTFGQNPTELSREAKKKLPGNLKHLATVRNARDYINAQETAQIYRKRRIKFQRKPFFAAKPNELWLVDCGYMLDLKRHNDNKGYLLVVIDCFTRMAFVKDCKTLKSAEISGKFQEILNEVKPNPRVKRCVSDRGSEFGGKFQEMLRQNNVHHSFSKDPKFKTSIPENFFRNFKRLIFKEIRATGNKNYVNKLQKLMLIHNSRKNRSLGMSPMEATKKENWVKVYNRLYSNRWKNSNSIFKFRKGQIVKILKLESFAKSFKGFDWSDEQFRINRRVPSRPPTYILTDNRGEIIDGAFYHLCQSYRVENEGLSG